MRLSKASVDDIITNLTHYCIQGGTVIQNYHTVDPQSISFLRLNLSFYTAGINLSESIISNDHLLQFVIFINWSKTKNVLSVWNLLHEMLGLVLLNSV